MGLAREPEPIYICIWYNDKNNMKTKPRTAHYLPKFRAPTHPGEMLSLEFLKPLKITQTRFAEHLGWTHAKVNEIIRGKRGVTPATALAFADVLGTTAEFWMNLQNGFDLWLAKREHQKLRRIKRATRL